MSEENVKVVREIFATFEGVDVASFMRELPRLDELPVELRNMLEATYP
jgi:hypothetical protein